MSSAAKGGAWLRARAWCTPLPLLPTCPGGAPAAPLPACPPAHCSPPPCRFIKGLDERDARRAQLGLAHAYSRAKVKFNVNKADNMIIQAIALLDTLDKDVNTFVMRVREW